MSFLRGAEKLVKNFRTRELARSGVKTTGTSTPSLVPKSVRNPFLPHQNQLTGCWQPPKYSLRRQAELVKKAKLTDNMQLLPPGPKTLPSVMALLPPPRPAVVPVKTSKKKKPVAVVVAPAVWKQDVNWVGDVKEKKVAGAEFGARLYAGKKKMFKGHKWERVQAARLMKRVILMRDMKKRVDRYKGHYQRRKPNPLAAGIASDKAPKLPY